MHIFVRLFSFVSFSKEVFGVLLPLFHADMSPPWWSEHDNVVIDFFALFTFAWLLLKRIGYPFPGMFHPTVWRAQINPDNQGRCSKMRCWEINPNNQGLCLNMFCWEINPDNQGLCLKMLCWEITLIIRDFV